MPCAGSDCRSTRPSTTASSATPTAARREKTTPTGHPIPSASSAARRMRAINAARDLVRNSLELLSERAYTELSERENGSPAPAWWEDAIFEDPSGLGVRWNPGAVRIPWRQRFEQARLALCIAVGDSVTVEHDGDAHARPGRGLRQLGARQPAHRLGRAADRAAADRRRGPLPRRLALDRRCRRRPRGGLALPRVRADEHARRAARAPLPALHPALAHRLRALGRARPPLAQAAPQAARARPRGHAVLARAAPRPSATSTTGSPTPARASSRSTRRSAALDAALAVGRGGRRGVRGARRAHAHARRRRAPPARARALRRRGQARAHRPRSHGRAARRAAHARRRARPRAHAPRARATSAPREQRAGAAPRPGQARRRARGGDCGSCAAWRSS